MKKSIKGVLVNYANEGNGVVSALIRPTPGPDNFFIGFGGGIKEAYKDALKNAFLKWRDYV